MAQAKDHFTNNGSLKCSIEFIYLFTLLNFRHCEKIFFKHVVAFFPKPEMLKSTTSDHTDSRSFLSMLIEIVMGTNKQWTKSKELQWQYDIQWQYITSFPLGIKGGGGWEPDLCWYKNKDCQGWSGFTQRWWVMNHQQIEHHCFPPVSFTSWMMVR